MKHKPILVMLASIGLLGWVAVMAVVLSQAATLTTRRGDQSFEANLTFEDGTFHLLAIGKHTCASEDHG